MGLFYDDKKILAARWLLNELVKHIRKYKSEIAEYNGYRSDVVLLSDITNTQKIYDIEVINEASKLLEKNEHIIYQSKDLRTLENSKMYISESGRQAIKSSFYSKILIKKWAKRLGIVFGLLLTATTLYKIFSPHEQKASQSISTQIDTIQKK